MTGYQPALAIDTLEANAEVAALFTRYRHAKAMEARAAELVAEAREDILDVVGPMSAHLTYQGQALGSKITTTSWRVDVTKVRADFPEVADLCLKASTSTAIRLPKDET